MTPSPVPCPVECFRCARPDEVGELEALQRRTALFTGDYREQILAHPDAIEIPPAFVSEGRARVAVAANRIVGFSVVLPGAEGVAELDGLFVEPEWMGRGVGRALLEDAFKIGRGQGVRRIEVTSNPRAVGFYETMGFVADSLTPTRFAPALRMHIDLPANENELSDARVAHRGLETERLRLLPNDLQHVETLRAGVAAFTERFGLSVAEGFAEFQQPPERDATVALEWDSFLIIHRADQTVIGACACRKFPDAAGAVEIAYGIVPGFRGRGVATEAARALAERALRRDDVRMVFANTLPELNASARVLAKCGFKHVGDAIDPDEGTVWKWELPRGYPFS